jgi:two-component system sensor histidine kinase VicK
VNFVIDNGLNQLPDKTLTLFTSHIEAFSVVINTSPLQIFLCRGEQLIIEIANPAALKAWDKDLSVIGMAFDQAIPELNDKAFKSHMLEAYRNGKPWNSGVHKVDLMSGGCLQTQHLSCSYQPFLTDDDEVAGVFYLASEAAEKVVAEQEMNISEESLRLAVEATKLGTFDNDLVSKQIYCNGRCREIFGIRHVNAVSYLDDFLPGLHPDDRKRINTYLTEFVIKKSFSDGEYEVEYRTVANSDRQVRWIRSRGKAFFDEHDRPIRFIGTVMDITEFKIADEKSAMLAAIIESSEDAIISKTLDGTITSWNKAAERMFGYTDDEIIGKSILNMISPNLHDEEKQILATLQEGNRVEHFETRRVKKDGSLLDVSLTISPIKDSSGNIIGISKIARDISEKKILEEKKNDFMSMASHELKTPLTTVKAYVQLLLAKALKEENKFRIEALQRVERQANRMVTLIQNFLDNARLVEGKFSIEQEEFKIHDLMTEVLQDAKFVFDTHNVLLVDCEDTIVIADRFKISQVIDNLISNAVKYSAQGSTVTISCGLTDTTARITVTDQGVGINLQDQEKLFERFYRVTNRNVKNVAGFGIGLYLVAEILRSHGTEIYVKSKEGVGSSFYFDLPLAH